MNSNLSLDQIEHLFGKFFQRFHVLIFVVLSLGGLIAATVLLYGLVRQSGANTSTSAPGVVFDQATIKKLDAMPPAGTSVQSSSVPKAKRNPFTE